MDEENLQGRGLKFHLSEDNNRLQVDYQPDGPVVPVDFAWLKHALDAQRAATGFFIFEHASGDLKKRYNEATEAFTLDIGERRDGCFTVSLAPDRMSAMLNLSPAYGGIPVAREKILETLNSMHIVSGILPERIDTALMSGRETENLVIAEGRPPVNGENAQLLSLLPEVAEHVPEESDTEVVDYRNISDIISVKAGTPVMRRIPPTLGVPGEDVTGEPLAAEDGVDLLFADNLSGVCFDPADPDLLLAEIGGMPVLVPDGVTIEPVIKVKNVDLSTGNLHFDGSVEVEGDVKEGMELRVAGDVSVKGVVEAATIICEGNVTVMGGVIGHGLEAAHPEHPSEHAVIKAQGNVAALFVENAIIESAADIEIKELAMKSELTASGQIQIGEDGSKKGHLIGGSCRAGKKIKAIIVGSRASVQTRIEVGVEPMVSERLKETQQLIEAKEKELEEIEKDRVYCREHPERFTADRSQQLEHGYQELQSNLAELFGQKKRLQKQLTPDPDACVEVERDIFYGVSVKIGEHHFLVEDDQFGGTFMVVGEELVLASSS
ncbi:DUF342 domain-containing protein [Geobacter pelophilus]|uniref:DUF342 domain-containing protein n=1 Tax=Geoanaerobacter pelophilus TaxID=60036 RepID=A0AAW4KXL6_9BACT|nr:FapA family protein [Geoanaerobacter pelophilus]MBT0663469.1 DUF342 domain-containing protein [Geoanaerobacter pelophilus]